MCCACVGDGIAPKHIAPKRRGKRRKAAHRFLPLPARTTEHAAVCLVGAHGRKEGDWYAEDCDVDVAKEELRTDPDVAYLGCAHRCFPLSTITNHYVCPPGERLPVVVRNADTNAAIVEVIRVDMPIRQRRIAALYHAPLHLSCVKRSGKKIKGGQ